MYIFFRWKLFFGIAFTLFAVGDVFAQQEPLFKKIELDSLGIRCYEMMCTKDGAVLFTTSIGMWKMKGHQMTGSVYGISGEITDVTTGKKSFIKNFRSYLAEDSISAMAEGPDSIYYYASHDNILSYSLIGHMGVGWPPFVFPPKGQPFDKVSALYIDNSGNLFIGTNADNFYWIREGARRQSFMNFRHEIIDSVVVVVDGGMPVKKIILAPLTGVFSFAQDSTDKNIIWVGTNHGLYKFNKVTGESKLIEPANTTAGSLFTITHIETDKQSNLWFSTLEKGMGFYYQRKNNLQFYLYPKKDSSVTPRYSIKTFCYKSDHDFFVAVMDSLPAIFNIKSGAYAFIDDPSLKKSADSTTDIKVDKLGNLLAIKGGALYVCKASENKMLATAISPDSDLLAPFIYSVSFQNGEEIASINYRPELLKELKLKYDQNSIIIYYDLNDVGEKSKVQFAWKMEGITSGWVVRPMLNLDSANTAFISDLMPGKYVFELKLKVGNEDWRKQQTKMTIIITPPIWQTWWFRTAFILGVGIIISFLFWYRLRVLKLKERERFAHEKQILELEAKALRAQMNPHFIFNCLNSIKSLIQQNENEKSVTYLTTFSKLIRSLFNNADKKEISLYDEIETCKLYLQLEAMRFDARFSFRVSVDDTVDLKSIPVPALIVQPFIENAIWHGIVPGNNGGDISLNITKKNTVIKVMIDDNGIGREAAQQNKNRSGLIHQSKGVNLTQSRLELNNLLQQRQAKLEIIDKKDEQGVATGTTVIINLEMEIS